ncbi:MAG: carboxypeptidase-like regulatory domain-containing protein [Candidatus Cybelea sp.]|jgi:protocatechuate 3,4-dioxygenase beta subunit
MKFSQFNAAAATFVLAVLVGHVTDATTGQPLANVTISIGSQHTSTDKHGAYRLTGLSPGHYTLSAGSNDVPPQRRSAVVKQDSAQTTLDLVLCSTTLDYSCAGAGPG